VLDDAGVERPPDRAAPQRREPAPGQRPLGRTQAGLGAERHGPRRPGQRAGQLEPVAQLQHGRHLVGVLGPQHVPGAPGEPVQLRAHVEQQPLGVQHVTGRAVDELGRGEGVDELHVAQPAVAALQVGLHAVRDVTDLAPARVRALDDLVEPAADPGPPRLADGVAHAVGECGVARDVPDLEQPERGAQVGGRHLHGLPGGADRVVEPDPGVPQRVPELVGDPVDVLAPVVQQHEIEVRPGGQLAAAERPDGHQRGPVGEPDRGGPGGQPEVVQVDERGAQGLGGEPALALTAQQHRLRAHQILGVPRRDRPGTHSASAPRSPVRTRTTVSTAVTHTLPSPIFPVRAEAITVSITLSTTPSSTTTSTRTLGTKSTW
jgi:hypothetical protein